MKGSIFLHLRACQQLIQCLLSEPQQEQTRDDRKLLGFALEIYAYLVLVNTITPHSTTGGRAIYPDYFITSLGTLSGYDTFGTMFAGAHGLFEIIPKISLLFEQRLEEQAGNCSLRNKSTYTTLLNCITNWKLCEIGSVSTDMALQRESAAEVYRYALLIYLETAMSGPVVDDPATICKIQDYIDSIISLSFLVEGSQYGAIILWPIVIAGSCMVKDSQRKILTASLKQSRYQMQLCIAACELFQYLWSDPDRRAYGPYGLHLIMQKHDINYCLL